MQVAFAIWGARISPVFDVSRHLLILEIEDGTVKARREQWLSDERNKVRMLCESKVNALICGAVSNPLADMIEGAGIRLIAFVTGDVESVIAEYLSGNLPNPDMIMPGCESRRYRRRRKQTRKSLR